MARKYKVLVGSHIEDEREYKAGDELVSYRDLTGLFNSTDGKSMKFQDLGPVEEKPRPVIVAEPIRASVPPLAEKIATAGNDKRRR